MHRNVPFEHGSPELLIASNFKNWVEYVPLLLPGLSVQIIPITLHCNTISWCIVYKTQNITKRMCHLKTKHKSSSLEC